MTGTPELPADDAPMWSRGCLRAGVALPALVVLAPLAAVTRGLRRWRRGRTARTGIERRGAAGRCRLDLRLNVPAAAESTTRLRLTDALVRVAEAVRAADDVYHLVWRPGGDQPAWLRAVGPQVQELGDRVALELGRPVTRGHTLLWLALGRARRLGEVVDGLTADPDAAGEPDGLVAACDPRWAAATAVANRSPSLILHLAVWVPPPQAEQVERILHRLIRGA